MLQLLINNYIR